MNRNPDRKRQFPLLPILLGILVSASLLLILVLVYAAAYQKASALLANPQPFTHLRARSAELAAPSAAGVSSAQVAARPVSEQRASAEAKAAPAAPAAAGDAILGHPVEQYFADSCSGCHGRNREGSVGPALVPSRLDQKDEFYQATIKNGRPGTVMPAFGAAGLGDNDISQLVKFIKSESKQEDLEWEIDQIRASRTVLVDEASLSAKPTHTGNVDNLMLVTERESRRIAVLDADKHTLLGHVDASYRAHGYTFDPTNDRWAYNVGRDGWLFRVDLYTLQATTKVKVGLDSRGVALSDDGRYVIVGNYVPATAVILDAKTLQPVKVIHTDGNDPEGKFVRSRVCITSDVDPVKSGPYFIIALKDAGQMWRIDWSKPDFPILKVEKVGHILHDGFLSPDNKFFYIASQTDNWMGVIDVVNWKLVTQISTGTTPHPGSGAAWNASDGHVYGATTHAGEGKVTVWDLSNNKIAGTIPTAGPGLFLRSAENSPYVWADSMFASPANHIYVFEKTPPFKVVKVIEDGIQPLHPEFTPDGKLVYVPDWQGNVVRVYNATTFEKIAEIGGVEAPSGIFGTERRTDYLGH